MKIIFLGIGPNSGVALQIEIINPDNSAGRGTYIQLENGETKEVFNAKITNFGVSDNIATLLVSEGIETPALPELVCKDSCPLNEKCYPFGYRKEGKYCSDEGMFKSQFSGEETCENNFECSSNVCVDGRCISSSLIERIIEWFKRLFG